MLSIIVAYDQNRVIGRNGEIPWKIPDDMGHFKKMTSGHSLILGRKTWESLGAPLPNRDHYVLTRSFKGVFHKIEPHVFHVCNIQWAADLIRYTNKTGWVIGGGDIYKLALDEGLVDRIVASEVKGIHNGDVFFPKLGNEWVRTHVKSYDLFDVVWYVQGGTQCLDTPVVKQN